MSNILWQRLGAASGIVYVVLLIGGVSIGGPDIQIAFLMEILGFLFFLFFLGNLWSALRGAEGGNGWLSATAFGGGLMSVTIKVASAAPVLAARYRANDGIDPQIARTLQDINNASFYLSFFPLAVLLAAFAIVVIRSGGLPRWLGWAAAVISVALIAGAAAGSANLESEGPPFLLFLLWTLVTSIALMRRAGQPLPTVESAHRD